MPISLVRSSTTTFMMFETPMPPTMSVKEPMIPRKRRKDRKNTPKKANSSVVSHTEKASLSAGSKRCRWARTRRTPSVTALLSPATAGW